MCGTCMRPWVRGGESRGAAAAAGLQRCRLQHHVVAERRAEAKCRGRGRPGRRHDGLIGGGGGPGERGREARQGEERGGEHHCGVGRRVNLDASAE